jgi:hypothetical protein
MCLRLFSRSKISLCVAILCPLFLGSVLMWCLQYTVNMKKIEVAVKQIVSGKDVKPSGTVANPDALKLYYRYRDIEKFAAPNSKL